MAHEEQVESLRHGPQVWNASPGGLLQCRTSLTRHQSIPESVHMLGHAYKKETHRAVAVKAADLARARISHLRTPRETGGRGSPRRMRDPYRGAPIAS